MLQKAKVRPAQTLLYKVLRIASLRDDAELVAMTLNDFAADVNSVDDDEGNTALIHAVRASTRLATGSQIIPSEFCNAIEAAARD